MSVLAFVAFAVPAQQPTPASDKKQPEAAVAPPPGIFFQRGDSANPFGGTALYQPAWNMFGGSSEELELSRQCETLVKQLAKAEGAEKDKIKTKLTESIEKQFDVRQKRHEAEITALENQLKKLKEMVQKRQENKKDIVGKRFEQLIRESEGLGW
jgi:hypothetical protein